MRTPSSANALAIEPRLAPLLALLLALACGGRKTHTNGSGQAGAGGSVMRSGAGGADAAAGGAGATGGAAGTAGTAGRGGAPASGGSGGASESGGSGGTAVLGGAAGETEAGGAAGEPPAGDCAFTVSSQTADQAGPDGIPTVGLVDWSVDRKSLASARIVFGLPGAAPLVAPVDVSEGPSFHTLLLGMKAMKTYTFHVEASDGTTLCRSADHTITTGAVPNTVPPITRTLGDAAAAEDRGFILTCARSTTSVALILDADGDPVWWAPAPAQCSRVQMSYDGKFMWMITVNVQNTTANGGEVDRVSMDGLTTHDKIAAFSNCHHDLTVLPDGGIACLSWIQQRGNQPSDLIEGDVDGNVKTIRRLDSTAYLAQSYHANSIHYHPGSKTFTVSDRQPNLYVKLTEAGDLVWQFGGDCTNAPAPQCVPGTWRVNHGHHYLDDGSGSFLFFNNGSSGASTVHKYKLDEGATFTATELWAYSPGLTSGTLGDVQELPNGNALVVFSNAGVIQEIDPSQQLVQSITGAAGGYIEWRESLYGPPPRL